MTQLLVVLPCEMPASFGGNGNGNGAAAGVPNSQSVHYLTTVDGVNVAGQSSAVPALLPASSGLEVVALVPAAQLSWHQVRLPRGTLKTGVMADAAAPRLRAVLEGLLEEHLLDEPAVLHFAVEPDAQDAADCTVAVCDRTWLKAWVQLLEQHQHTVQRIVPEISPVAAGASLSVQGNTEPFLVWGGTAPLVLPLTSATAALVHWPAELEVLAEPAHAALAEKLFGRRVTLQQKGQRWLAALGGNWDLAQFDLASSSGSRRWRRWSAWGRQLTHAPRWRAARWAVLVLAFTQVFGLNGLAWVERNRLEAKQQQVRNLLTQTFPQVKYVIDAPLQMRRELNSLRQNAGYSDNTDLENLLAALGKLGLDTSAAREMDYGQGELRLKGVTWSEQDQIEAGKKLKTEGLESTMQDGVRIVRAQVQP